jgi:hypothetical protein
VASLAIAAIMAVALALVLAPQKPTPPSTEVRDRLQVATTEAYARIHPEADRIQAAGIAVLVPVLGKPKLQSRVVFCELDSRERGFVGEGWNQRCILRTVDLYQTNESYDQLSKQLAAAAAKHKAPEVVLGRSAARPPLPKGCPVVRLNVERHHLRVRDERPFYQVNLTQLQAGRFKPFGQSDPTHADCTTPPPDDDGDYRQSRIEKVFRDSEISLGRSCRRGT